ncbi:MAG TPA: hypothetical protein PKO10_01115, partial [Aliarcobacter cryaerophilus]|nr:hypothetical protein [Aliarcobacter cryaerophilus]
MRRDELWNLRAGGYIEPLYPGYNILVRGSNKYVNFGVTVGDSGYGLRDNSGTMQFKNNSGSWTDIGSGSTGSDEKVKLNAEDPTAGYLDDKIIVYGFVTGTPWTLEGYITDISGQDLSLADNSTSQFITIDDVPTYQGDGITITGTGTALDPFVAHSAPTPTTWDAIGGDQTDVSLSGFTNDLDTGDFTNNAGFIIGADVPSNETDPVYESEKANYELVANKSTNVVTDAASDTKYPSVKAIKEYADSKVEDSITDGVTTKAPSQNAVFDALAGKAPTDSPTFTGNT